MTLSLFSYGTRPLSADGAVSGDEAARGAGMGRVWTFRRSRDCEPVEHGRVGLDGAQSRVTRHVCTANHWRGECL